MNLCIVVGYAKDNVDKATISFTLAHAAIEDGHKVRVVLTSEGVRIPVRGYADDMNNDPPFLPLRDLIANVLVKGGEINVCTPCMAKRGLHPEDMIPKMQFIDGTGFVRLVAEADRAIQL